MSATPLRTPSYMFAAVSNVPPGNVWTVTWPLVRVFYLRRPPSIWTPGKVVAGVKNAYLSVIFSPTVVAVVAGGAVVAVVAEPDVVAVVAGAAVVVVVVEPQPATATRASTASMATAVKIQVRFFICYNPCQCGDS